MAAAQADADNAAAPLDQLLVEVEPKRGDRRFAGPAWCPGAA
jgi:hypothetical protein